MGSLAISFTENSILEKEGKIGIFVEKSLKKNYKNFKKIVNV